VRYVIHADPPAAIEAYWQEIGRAGRDGAPAEGITLYSSSDLAWAMRRIDSRDMDGSVKAAQMRKVRQLYAMLDGTSCRPAAVRRYFGESSVTACGQCDLCLNPPEAADATEAAQKALSAVHRLGGRLGRGRVIDHLLGKTKDVMATESAMSTYGIGREFSQAGWRDLLVWGLGSQAVNSRHSFFLHSSFFVRLESPFLRPDPFIPAAVARRGCQGRRFLSAAESSSLTGPSTTALSVAIGMTIRASCASPLCRWQQGYNGLNVDSTLLVPPHG